MERRHRASVAEEPRSAAARPGVVGAGLRAVDPPPLEPWPVPHHPRSLGTAEESRRCGEQLAACAALEGCEACVIDAHLLTH